MYHQNTLKFHKILILAPYVSTGAQHLEKGGENEVQNGKFMENFENLRNDPGSSQMTPGGSGSFDDHKSCTKKVSMTRRAGIANSGSC